MIDREDMLALTRRMTVKRTSMTRIAGGYMDSDGCIDGTFNIAFLKLSPANREKNLQIAKKVPFAETNQNLQEYKFLQENMQNDSLWKLLMGMRACGLKNDDNVMYRTYRLLRGSHTYNTEEMSRLIDGMITMCKEAGIPDREIATPEEKRLLKERYGVDV